MKQIEILETASQECLLVDGLAAEHPASVIVHEVLRDLGFALEPETKITDIVFLDEAKNGLLMVCVRPPESPYTHRYKFSLKAVRAVYKLKKAAKTTKKYSDVLSQMLVETAPITHPFTGANK